MLNAYVESSDAVMTVVALESTGNVLDKALADISKVKVSQVRVIDRLNTK
jgi:hypothetical protein